MDKMSASQPHMAPVLVVPGSGPESDLNIYVRTCFTKRAKINKFKLTIQYTHFSRLLYESNTRSVTTLLLNMTDLSFL